MNFFSPMPNFTNTYFALLSMRSTFPMPNFLCSTSLPVHKVSSFCSNSSASWGVESAVDAEVGVKVADAETEDAPEVDAVVSPFATDTVPHCAREY